MAYRWRTFKEIQYGKEQFSYIHLISSDGERSDFFCNPAAGRGYEIVHGTFDGERFLYHFRRLGKKEAEAVMSAKWGDFAVV